MYIGNGQSGKPHYLKVSDLELESDGLLKDEGPAEVVEISPGELEKIGARIGKVRFERDNLEMDERLNFYPDDIDRV
ncbi:hypothetical protein NIES4075_62800 [Tolypothrix sp. NIES-4075]|uniref:hypothetical protein n=1 Tax=Tolypothrix sp. NIES-4075 TaxID=2005459 RepID=UPI000B5C3FB6|nr:hypothetical protein [Tolypothrix sp. NIES-4075]GAX45259.1 hypothetical protein NIES4075_62800 [Tolypothrix sp. NIES-4075]